MAEGLDAVKRGAARRSPSYQNFVQNQSRANVAITRAREVFWVIGRSMAFKNDPRSVESRQWQRNLVTTYKEEMQLKGHVTAFEKRGEGPWRVTIKLDMRRHTDVYLTANNQWSRRPRCCLYRRASLMSFPTNKEVEMLMTTGSASTRCASKNKYLRFSHIVMSIGSGKECRSRFISRRLQPCQSFEECGRR